MFVFARLCHEILQHDQIPLRYRYVQVISAVYIFGNAFAEFDSRYRSHHIQIGGLPLTITPYDTLRRWTYSFLCILQERFHPYSLTALGTSCNDACKWVFQNCRSISRHCMRMLSVGFSSCTSRLCRCKLNGLEKYFPQIWHE